MGAALANATARTLELCEFADDETFANLRVSACGSRHVSRGLTRPRPEPYYAARCQGVPRAQGRGRYAAVARTHEGLTAHAEGVDNARLSAVFAGESELPGLRRTAL